MISSAGGNKALLSLHLAAGVVIDMIKQSNRLYLMLVSTTSVMLLASDVAHAIEMDVDCKLPKR